MINVRGQVARRREWAAQQRMSLAFERGLTAKLRAEFLRTGRQAAQQAVIAHHADVAVAHKHRLIAILRPYVKAIYSAFYVRLQRAFAGKMAVVGQETKYTEAELAAETDAYIEAWVSVRMDSVSKVTQKRISDAINEGRANDDSWSDIAKSIVAETGGDIGDARARTIARTEMHGASQAGSQASAEDMEIPGLMKEWLSVGDDRVRPDHADADGQTVALDEDFTVGGEELSYPGDPQGSPEETINCRCVQTYTTDKG